MNDSRNVQERRTKGSTVALITVIACIMLAGVGVGAAVAVDKFSSPDSDAVGESVPAYQVTGHTADSITVEVGEQLESADLDAVVRDVRHQVALQVLRQHAPEITYTLVVNCSTGGTDFADNRLATARFGFGDADPGVPIEALPNRVCPA